MLKPKWRALLFVAALLLAACDAFVARGPKGREASTLFAKKKAKGKAAKKVSTGGFGSKVVELSKEEEEIQVLSRKLKSKGGDAMLWFQLASQYAELEEYAEARQLLEAGIANCGEDEAGSKKLVDALAAMRRTPSPPEIAEKSASLKWPGKDGDHLEPYDDEEAERIGFDCYSVPEAPRPCHRGTQHRSGEGIIWASRGWVIPPEECDWVIQQVEQAAVESWIVDQDRSNIGSDAIYDRPFPDRIWLRDVPGVMDWFTFRLKTRLFPMLQKLYPDIIHSPDDLRCHDTAIVRYSAEGMASLEQHRDSTSFSFTIALNRASDYEGGGTYFSAIKEAGSDEEFSGRALKTDIGGCVSFPGQCWHGGNKITSGHRYIIPLFMFLDFNKSRKPRGYSLEKLKGMGVIGEYELVF